MTFRFSSPNGFGDPEGPGLKGEKLNLETNLTEVSLKTDPVQLLRQGQICNHKHINLDRKEVLYTETFRQNINCTSWISYQL